MLKSMNKKWHNLPRITAVLLLISAFIGTLYLSHYAPTRADTIGNVTIRTEQTTHLVLNGNQFNCPITDGNERALTCSVLLEGQLLEMKLTTTQGIGSTITNCEARFGGQTVVCQGSYSMRYRGPIVVVEETLGISEARYTQLRRLHWRDQWSERTWIQATLIFVILLALNAGILLWQTLSEQELKLKWQIVVTVMGSLGVFLFLRLSSAIILLSQGWID